jgi:hypothetical protein
MGFPFSKKIKVNNNFLQINTGIKMQEMSDSHSLELVFRRIDVKLPYDSSSNLLYYKSSTWGG